MAGARGLGGDCEWWEVGGKGGCPVELGGRSEAQTKSGTLVRI